MLGPRGIDFVRHAIAKAHGAGSPRDTFAYASSRWGARSVAAELAKAAVAGGGSGSGEWGAELATAGAEFLDFTRPLTILGRLQGLRYVPARTQFVAQTGGATAYWRRAGRAAPLSAGAFDLDSMETLGLAAMMVFPNELLADSSAEAERLVLSDMGKADVELSDVSFIDPASAGVNGQMPAAVTHGAPTIASTGDVADDLEAAIGAFGGDLSTASWVLHPRLAVQMGLRAGGRGVAADLGARGGLLAGLPAITSESCDYSSDGGTIALIDAAGICMLDQGIEVKRSRAAAVEMSNTPTGDTTTPTAATTLVPLFQSESTALLMTRRINWKVAKPGAVVCIVNARYPAP